MVRKCPLTEAALKDCVYNICDLINTYESAFGVRYDIALENIMYLMSKNCVPVDNKFILETVTDYFLMTELNEETADAKLHDMIYIIEILSSLALKN